MKRALITLFLVLVADQALKFWVKLHMFYDTAFPLFGDWAYIHFIENPGMAFGLRFGGEWGKLALTVFRIVASVGIAFYLRHLVRSNASTALLISTALVLAGAIGNIIDSAFYGLIFDKGTVYDPVAGGYVEYMGLARLSTQGYTSFLHGSVVDMFYFPLYDGHLPDWLPMWGGERFQFFRPVFNIADASISVGIAAYVLVQRGGRKEEHTPQPEVGHDPLATPATEERPEAPQNV